MIKKTGTLLFIFTLISPIAAFTAIYYVGETRIFAIPGMLRCIWIFYLFSVFAIASLGISVFLKRRGLPYKKNIVAAVIILPVLLLFGSFRLIFQDSLDYSSAIIEEAEQKISFALPKNVRVAVEINNEYKLGYAKFLDEKEIEQFEQATKSDDRWCGTLPTSLRGALPYVAVGAKLDDYETILFWNDTLKEYNTYPKSDGEYDCLLVAYDHEDGNLMIFSDYLLIVRGNL